MLLTGGNGRLDIGADGTLGSGRGNQLVRTRASYARAGFAVLVPDTAATSSRVTASTGSRFSQAHADDMQQTAHWSRRHPP